MTTISVVVPAYNRAALIGSTLRSLLAQTQPAAEVIVVDDGSTDSTAETVERFGPPVRVIRQRNSGPGAARNRGFQESRGDFIHFFDSDDLAAPNKHQVQMDALVRTGADIAYGPWLKGRFDRQIFLPENHALQQRGLPRGDLVRALLTRWSIVPHAALFRRSIVERAGEFQADLFGTEDQMMFLDCLLAGASVVHTPATLELYRSGSVGKITEFSPWQLRHKTDWARFLIRARLKCISRGIEPLDWFGYRMRLWQALTDLQNLPTAPSDVIGELRSLLCGREAPFLFTACKLAERWRGGLQRRLTGGRGNSSFRIGPVTREQKALILGMGYQVS
jgi:glycosyltransferase involved in cell wall biosynthesis